MKQHPGFHTWEIAKLKVHPRQTDLVGDVSDAELAALAEDMRQHGLSHPIEILPDGTIVAGHQRVRAAKLLGWKKIKVIIRFDLAEAGEEAVTGYLIRDNWLRRQASPLTRARWIKELLTLRYGLWSRLGLEKTKAEIGNTLNLSARTVNRYLLVLKTLPEVQQAFDQGDISLVDAGKVATLGRQQQASIAERIAAGESPEKVVREFVQTNNGRHARATDGFSSLCKAIQRGLDDLEDRAEKVHRRAVKENLPLLERGWQFLGKLVATGKEEISQ